MQNAASPEQLQNVQYKDATQLDARMALHRDYSVNRQGWPAWLFEQLPLAGRADILEVGCGPGTLWAENASRIPSGWKILLSDFSLGMLDEARERLRGVEHAFEFQQIDAGEIRLPDQHVDCVIANHMLYHVEDRPQALSEIRRVLRPGGLLFASTLSRDTLKEMEDAVKASTSRKDFGQMRPSAGFRLDDGERQLEPFFERVEKRNYEDALEVTEVEPLLAYYRSLILDEPFRDDELASVASHVRDVIARDGAFHVRKSGGVFLAWKTAA